MPQRIQRRRTTGWSTPLCSCGCGKPARYVGRPTRFGNPFTIGGPSGLARVPAVDYPGHEWEYEGRISAAGMRHDYHHPDGRITHCTIRNMTAAETVECYRAYVTGGGWPIDWKPFGAPTLDEIRSALAGHDLACWCLLPEHGQPDHCHAAVLLSLANGGA